MCRWGKSPAKPFKKIECVVEEPIGNVAEEGIQDALEEEIHLMLEKEGKSYSEWKTQQDENKREQSLLIVSYDMGWQKRSSGNR